MKRILKYGGIIVAALVGLLILIVVVLNIIPGKYYKSLISSKVESATGREFAIEGYFDMNLFTTFAFKAADIRFSNAEWGSRPQMVSIDNIEGEIALLPLLRGILAVTLVLDKPNLFLETDISGQPNWQFKKLADEKEEDGETAKVEAEGEVGLPLRPLIRKLQFNDTHIAYLDGNSNDRIEIDSEKLYIGTTEDVLTVEVTGKLNDIPLDFSGSLTNPEIFVNNQQTEVRLDGHFGDAKLAAQGTAGPLVPTIDLDVTVNMDTQNVAEFSSLAGKDLPDLGPFSMSVHLVGKEGQYAVSNLLTKLDDKKLSLDAKGSVADLTALDGLKLEAHVNTGHLTEILQGMGYQTKYKLPDSLNSMIMLEGSLDDLAVKQFHAKILGQGLTVSAGAEVKNLMTLEGVTADFLLEAKSLDLISEIAKKELPPLGGVKARANIASRGQNLSLIEVTGNLTGEWIHVDVAGAIEDPLKTNTINARVDLGIESLDWLSEYIKKKLPPLGSLTASANIASKDGAFILKDIRANLGGENIQAEVTGSIKDLLKVQGIDATVDLDVQSLAFLSEHIKMELPPLGPLSASAKIASKGETFEAKEIKVDITDEKIQARVTASVKDVLKLTGIDADINVAVESLASLDSLVKQKLPAYGPVTLEGKISSEGGLDAPVSIATVVKSDGVTANLKGSIAEPLKARGIDMALTVKADSLQKVGKLTGGQLQGQEPLKLEGKFTTRENSYELEGFSLQVGELDVKGHAVYRQASNSGGRPRVSGELHIGELNRSRGQAKAETSTETVSSPKSSKKKEVKKDKIFSSEPLPVVPIKSVDADVKVTVKSLKTTQLELKGLVSSIELDNGLLSIKPIKAKVGKGTFNGTVKVDTRNKPPALSANLEIKDATLRNFGGKINFLADLNGRGESIAALMGGLNGLLELDVRDVTLKKSFMTNFGSGLLNSLNPFRKDEEETELICAVLLFDIENGVADANEKIGAQMTEVTWFGSCEINLKTEEIDFGMHPKPRKGLGLSLGDLAKLVHVGGTLAEPKIELDPKDIAVKSGKYAAAIATGGITLAADMLWSRMKAETDICSQILEDLDSKKESKEAKPK